MASFKYLVSQKHFYFINKRTSPIVVRISRSFKTLQSKSSLSIIRPIRSTRLFDRHMIFRSVSISWLYCKFHAKDDNITLYYTYYIYSYSFIYYVCVFFLRFSNQIKLVGRNDPCMLKR